MTNAANNPPPSFKTEAGAEGWRPQEFDAATLRVVPTQTNFYFLENDDGVVTGNATKPQLGARFVGAAGEAFVQYDLLRRDVECHQASNIHSYDLIAIKDYRFIKIEVKTTTTVEIRDNGYTRYSFTVHNSQNNTNKYEEAGVEIFAFVALDIRSVLYLSKKDFDFNTQKMHIAPKRFLDSDSSFDRCFS